MGILDGKVALVTGSGQGIGRAIAKELAAHGAKVVTNNRKPSADSNVTNQLGAERLAKLSPEQLEWVERELAVYAGDAETTAQAIRDAGGDAIACFGDITDYNEAKKIVDKTVETYGSVDILVNVAGAFAFGPVEKTTPETWEKVTSVKPTGYFNMIRHCVPYMQEKKWGRIINCTSSAFLGGDLRQIAYATANAGVLGLTWAMASELAPYNITSHAFAPAAKTRSSIDMELFDKVVNADEKSTTSGNKFIEYDDTPPPEAFTAFIAYLASEEAAAYTGGVYMTMGGFIARYSNPTPVNTMMDPAGWTLDKVVEAAPTTLFKDYVDFNAPPARPQRDQ